MAESLNIAILGGSGQVGSRLASRLCLAGNNVILASRNPEDPKVALAMHFVFTSDLCFNLLFTHYER